MCLNNIIEIYLTCVFHVEQLLNIVEHRFPKISQVATYQERGASMRSDFNQIVICPNQINVIWIIFAIAVSMKNVSLIHVESCCQYIFTFLIEGSKENERLPDIGC